MHEIQIHSLCKEISTMDISVDHNANCTQLLWETYTMMEHCELSLVSCCHNPTTTFVHILNRFVDKNILNILVYWLICMSLNLSLYFNIPWNYIHGYSYISGYKSKIYFTLNYINWFWGFSIVHSCVLTK